MGFDHQFSDSSTPSAPLSFSQRLCSSIRSSCCWIGGGGGGGSSGDGEDERSASLMCSSATWFRWQNLVDWVTAPRHHHYHSRRASVDFRYDPFSYALNFDDGHYDDDNDLTGGGDGFRYRSFSSRLPPSLPHPAAVGDNS